MLKFAPVPLLLVAAAASAGPLTVTANGVRGAAGQVRVDVCVKNEFLKDRCTFAGSAPAAKGSVTVTVPEVRPGRYAVQIYHDENGNGRLERNFIGIPKEGYGFSNDIKPGFGPPNFDAAAIDMGAQPRRMAITMRYGR